MKEIAAGGHEIGLHSYRHTPLTEADPDTFRREVGDARAFMQDLAGQPVLGFRAPTFSLVESTRVGHRRARRARLRLLVERAPGAQPPLRISRAGRARRTAGRRACSSCRAR